jgi:hypothetical protein
MPTNSKLPQRDPLEERETLGLATVLSIRFNPAVAPGKLSLSCAEIIPADEPRKNASRA